MPPQKQAYDTEAFLDSYRWTGEKPAMPQHASPLQRPGRADPPLPAGVPGPPGDSPPGPKLNPDPAAIAANKGDPKAGQEAFRVHDPNRLASKHPAPTDGTPAFDSSRDYGRVGSLAMEEMAITDCIPGHWNEHYNVHVPTRAETERDLAHHTQITREKHGRPDPQIPPPTYTFHERYENPDFVELLLWHNTRQGAAMWAPDAHLAPLLAICEFGFLGLFQTHTP